jgi:hypothetical protein
MTKTTHKKRHLQEMPKMQENPRRVVLTPSQQSATVANLKLTTLTDVNTVILLTKIYK